MSARALQQSVDITVSDLEIMAKAIRYRTWLYEQVRPFVGLRVVEFGCGVGNYIEFLKDAERVIAVDVHDEALTVLKGRFPEDRRLTALKLEVGKDDIGPLTREKADTVICFNVMEHIEDHARVTRELWRALVPGGRLCLIVPAAPWAYGTMDEALLHFRRYRMRDVKELLGGAGFMIERAYHLNLVGLAGWFVNNRILMRRTESPAQIMTFDRLFVPWIRRLEMLIKPPIGNSIVCIGRKPL